ncbi:MAG: hypothetical protein JKY93_01120 [Gammaproteobacteria bacterium]|nr:hypothetical protein [Gammaproteobacteria bacterium]
MPKNIKKLNEIVVASPQGGTIYREPVSGDTVPYEGKIVPDTPFWRLIVSQKLVLEVDADMFLRQKAKTKADQEAQAKIDEEAQAKIDEEAQAKIDEEAQATAKDRTDNLFDEKKENAPVKTSKSKTKKS